MSQSGITVHIKGPSALKLALTVTLDMTVLQLKERIEQENADFPAARCVASLTPASASFTRARS